MDAHFEWYFIQNTVFLTNSQSRRSMCKLNCAQGIQIQNVLLYISTQENSHKNSIAHQAHEFTVAYMK